MRSVFFGTGGKSDVGKGRCEMTKDEELMPPPDDMPRGKQVELLLKTGSCPRLELYERYHRDYTSNRSEDVKKKLALVNCLTEFVSFDGFEGTYFDYESEELLDEKIEVMKALLEGKVIAEIPNYYSIFERIPKREELSEDGKTLIQTVWE